MSEPDAPTEPARAAGGPGRGDPPWYSRRVEIVLYLTAAVTYIGLGMFHKFLLNWIIGPLWLIAWVWLVPAMAEAVRRRTS